jgi:hypothetical protein
MDMLICFDFYWSGVASGDQLVGVEWEDVSESPDIMWAEPTSNVLLGRRLSPVPESPTVSVVSPLRGRPFLSTKCSDICTFDSDYTEC